jgi:SAM-dependent methyltransferase
MTISKYHLNYSSYSEEEIQKRADEKESELKKIFEKISPQIKGRIVNIAVLGCGDKRLIGHHQKIFKKIIKKPVEITTFDISAEHLAGKKNIIQHDCILPLPNAPYDLVYAHVLLKFIETEKQWDLLKNSYDALKPGGLAIHLLDKEDYEVKEARLSNGLFSVPLDRWKVKLGEISIKYKEMPVKYGLALVILKKTNYEAGKNSKL